MRTLVVSTLLLCAQCFAGDQQDDGALRDMFYGEALFYANQGEFFEAISRLDTELAQHHRVDEPVRDTLYYHVNDAEFSVGDFELSYRMHQKAGRAIKAVIEGDVDPQVRNEAIYRLAKIHFQKEQKLNALHAIERIDGEIPERLESEIEFLKGQIYMVNGKFVDAEGVFQALIGEDGQEAYAEYNLAMSQFAQNENAEAIQTMTRLGKLSSDDRAVLAIKDKANLTLGSRLMEAGEYQAAKVFLERVRLDGPYSNNALLGLGWASVTSDDYKQALVPWSLLRDRHVTDPAVQDALLGVPYAYGKLGLYGQAALGYGRALEATNAELDRLDASIASIKSGNFLKVLVREEIKQDPDWVIKLRELPETPETYYLMDLMASHDFQSSLQNYFDLEQLRVKLEQWLAFYDAYEDLIDIRKAYYEPLLPDLDERFRKLDSLIRLRMEQRDKIYQRLQAMLVVPRPEFLARSEEQLALRSLEAIEKSTSNSDSDTQRRIDRLRGILQWKLAVEYDERLTVTYKNLAALDKDIERLNEIYNSFVRTRQAATQSYQGYDEQIAALRTKNQRSLDTVEKLMLRQGHMLETMAVNELQERTQKLEVAQVKARFALAESYDRATMESSESVPENQKSTSSETSAEKDPSLSKVDPLEDGKSDIL